MQAVAANVVVIPELKNLERQLKNTPGGFLKIDMKSDVPKPSPPPMETDDPLDTIQFPCCNETVTDEGYLETEINYAIQERRKKGDKFAIITLQFVDDDGSVGTIPELLKTYVWKKPKTMLEALREIVRALPVLPGTVDWRDDITGVATAPKKKSTSTELSDEAKLILKEAIAGSGRITYRRGLGGQEISANGKSMIPDDDARTIARWVGGLEDLQRRRYIKDLGHKREVFEVTREGYEAADQLSDA